MNDFYSHLLIFMQNYAFFTAHLNIRFEDEVGMTNLFCSFQSILEKMDIPACQEKAREQATHVS